MSFVSLRVLLGRGVALSHYEAVAIVQQLISSSDVNRTVVEPLGPPSLDTVGIDENGSVVCRSSDTTPAVFEIGVLLESMLPRAPGVRVPGGLRYTIARALLEVEAPLFGSIGELSASLERYEKGDRSAVVRELYARGAAAARGVPPPAPERRRNGPTVAALRRQLREADEALFRLHPATAQSAVVSGFTSTKSALPADVEPMLSLRRGSDALAIDPIIVHGAPPGGVRQTRRFPWRSAGISGVALLVSLVAGYGFVREWREATAGRIDAHVAAVPSEPVVPPAASAAIPHPEPRAPGTPRHSAARFGVPQWRAHPSDAADRAAAEAPAGALPSAVQTADFRYGSLQVMAIADERARSYNVRLSPDGARVAFDSDRDGERAVYVAKRDGTDVQRVSGDGPAAAPAWSPDGTTLAFLRAETDRPHIWNLWTLDLRSSRTRRITSFRSGQTGGAAWFPDGAHLCYTHDDRLVVQDLDRGEATEYRSPVPERRVNAPAVSPDGEHVIFRVEGSGAWVLDVADGSMLCALTDPTAEAFAWSSDGRRVAYHSRRTDEWGLWVMAPHS